MLRKLHRLPCLLGSVLLVLFISATSLPASETEPPPRPIISSAAEIDFPPFSTVDMQGQARGFSVELLRAALAAMGRDVSFRTGSWAQARQWLEQGDVRALPIVGRTPEREELYDFTFPYMSLHGAIVVRADAEGISQLDDLRDRKVAVMAGDNAEEFLRRTDRGIDIHTTPTFEVALRELSAGRYDAVVVQRLVALRLLQETGLSNLRIIDRPIDDFRQDFCFAVQEGDRDTLALLNEGLSLVMADGTYRHLHAKWFAALQLPSSRRIVVGGDHNFPPFEYLNDNGQPEGFNVDLTRAIARVLDLDIEIRLGPWPEIMQALSQQEIDAAQGMFYSTGRDRTFDFTAPHTVMSYVGVIRAGEGLAPTTVDDLKNTRIVVQRGDIMHDLLVEMGLTQQLTLAATQQDALRQVAAAEADCALVARLVAMDMIERQGWENLEIGQRPILSPGYGYVVPAGHQGLLAQLGEGLKLLDQTGEYRQIQQKWLGVYEETSVDLQVFLRYAAIVLIPLGLLLLAAALWTWLLRRQVAQRTAELRKSEEKYRLLADHTLDAIWTMSPNLKFTYINPASQAQSGYTQEEWIGSQLEKHCDAENLLKINRIIADEIARGPKSSGVIFEAVLLNRERQPYPVEIHCKVVCDEQGQTVRLQGTTRDISERTQAEQNLLRIKSLLDRVQHISRIGGWEWDVDRQEMFFTEATYRLHDFDPAEPSPAGKTLFERSLMCYGEEDRLKIHAAFLRCINEGVPYELECRLTTEKGRQLWVRDVGEPAQTNGRTTKIVGSLQDITADKENESALRESEQRFRLLVESSPDAIFVQTEHRFRYLNRAAVDLFGANSADDLIGTPLMERVPTDFHDLVSKRMTLLNQHKIATARSEQVRLRMDNTPVNIETSAVPIHYQGKDGALVFLRDISERLERENANKLLQDQLAQAQKMESIGRLAGGVAHDFNNMLAVITGYAEMALDKVSSQQPLHADIREIMTAAKRSSEITRQLLAFASRQTVAPQVLYLNSSVEKTLIMLRRLIGEDIGLGWHPGNQLWPVKIDVTQVEQVITNLCVNARDAIDGVGKVTIETANVVFDDTYCMDHAGFAAGEYVLLAVSDDGRGMDAATMEKVFEPFFTTKQAARGTGLGLATVYGIVKQNKGFINAYSEPGLGTTIKIHLPRHTGPLPQARPESPASTIPPGCGETILLVEDEAPVLKLGQRMLETLGYQVLAASTPGKAITLAGEHGDTIALLLTDVVMPHMNGRELSNELERLHPQMKTVYMSGYTANVIADRGILQEGVRFLQKPFSFEDLAVKVAAALNRAQQTVDEMVS